MKNLFTLTLLTLLSLLLSSCGLFSLATLPIRVAGDVVEGSYNAAKGIGRMATAPLSKEGSTQN